MILSRPAAINSEVIKASASYANPNYWIVGNESMNQPNTCASYKTVAWIAYVTPCFRDGMKGCANTFPCMWIEHHASAYSQSLGLRCKILIVVHLLKTMRQIRSFNELIYVRSYLHIKVCHGRNIYYIFGHVHHVNVHRWEVFGHLQIFSHFHSVILIWSCEYSLNLI